MCGNHSWQIEAQSITQMPAVCNKNGCQNREGKKSFAPTKLEMGQSANTQAEKSTPTC
jgi:hypothetical protein